MTSSSRPNQAAPASSRWSPARSGFHALLLFAALSAGCSSSGNSWFNKPRTSQGWLDLALESENADDRRRGVTGLADSRDGRSDWAIKVYETVARTDKDTMVRCTAIRALGPVAGGAQVPLALKLLDSPVQRAADVRVAPGPVRWDAAKLLLAIVSGHSYEEPQRAAIVGTLLGRLSKDTDRNVKLTVIETLGYFPERPVAGALIDVLDEEDFAMQRAAEDSLIALTGTTHQYDAKAWRAWLTATPEPFKDAGKIPEGLAAKPKPRWSWDW